LAFLEGDQLAPKGGNWSKIGSYFGKAAIFVYLWAKISFPICTNLLSLFCAAHHYPYLIPN
jgi:hypothetical protein